MDWLERVFYGKLERKNTWYKVSFRFAAVDFEVAADIVEAMVALVKTTNRSAAMSNLVLPQTMETGVNGRLGKNRLFLSYQSIKTESSYKLENSEKYRPQKLNTGLCARHPSEKFIPSSLPSINNQQYK